MQAFVEAPDRTQGPSASVASALAELRIPANRTLDELLVDLRDRDPAFRREVHMSFNGGCTSLQWRAVPLHRKVDVFCAHYRAAGDPRSLRRNVVAALMRVERTAVYRDA